ncbi:hypothetical protein IGL98_001817 [Enterococcus sp. DIV0840]
MFIAVFCEFEKYYILFGLVKHDKKGSRNSTLPFLNKLFRKII